MKCKANELLGAFLAASEIQPKKPRYRNYTENFCRIWITQSVNTGIWTACGTNGHILAVLNLTEGEFAECQIPKTKSILSFLKNAKSSIVTVEYSVGYKSADNALISLSFDGKTIQEEFATFLMPNLRQIVDSANHEKPYAECEKDFPVYNYKFLEIMGKISELARDSYSKNGCGLRMRWKDNRSPCKVTDGSSQWVGVVMPMRF